MFMSVEMHTSTRAGQSPTIEGSITTNMNTGNLELLMPESLLPAFLVPDLAALLSSEGLVAEEEEEEEEPTMHPCGREIAACQEIGAGDRTSIEVCAHVSFPPHITAPPTLR